MLVILILIISTQYSCGVYTALAVSDKAPANKDISTTSTCDAEARTRGLNNN